jgi:hypothetical protein
VTWKYLPDVPRDTPNVWRGCDGFHADRYGVMRTGFMAASYSDYGSNNPWFGKAYRTAAGTLGIIVIAPYNGSGSGVCSVYDGSWNDRAGTASSKTIYVAEGVSQFGNLTYLACGGAGMFSRDATGSSNFAAVASSPAATVLLLTPRNIMVALNCITIASAGSDLVSTSDANDPTNWSTGESDTRNLRQTPGVLTAGVVFGNDVIAFKKRGVYRGQYIGGALKWDWNLVPGGENYGAWGPGAAISAAGKVYFYGDNGFHSFDGSSFQKLDLGIASTILHDDRGPVNRVR